MGRTPMTDFLATRLIFNYNYKQPLQEGLSGFSQCMGMGRLGWVKASHLLKYNHTNRVYGCFYVDLYEYYAFLAFK